MAVTLTRSGPNTDQPLTLDYTVVSDSATAGIDVAETSGTVEWATSDSLMKHLNLSLAADDLPEGEERLEILFAVSSGPATAGPGVPVLTELLIADHPFEQWIWDLYAGSPPAGSTGVGDDPDGNGIELYRDRAKEEWPRDSEGALEMVNAPLDVPALIQEARAAA